MGLDAVRLCLRGAALAAVVAVIAACGDRGAPDDDLQALQPPDIPTVLSASEALAGAHIPIVDPMTMNEAEIRQVFGAMPFCTFRYTSSGRPVLAVRSSTPSLGVVKLNGHLVALQPFDAGPSEKGLAWAAEPIRIHLTSAMERLEQSARARRRRWSSRSARSCGSAIADTTPARADGWPAGDAHPTPRRRKSLRKDQQRRTTILSTLRTVRPWWSWSSRESRSITFSPGLE